MYRKHGEYKIHTLNAAPDATDNCPFSGMDVPILESWLWETDHSASATPCVSTRETVSEASPPLKKKYSNEMQSKVRGGGASINGVVSVATRLPGSTVARSKMIVVK